VTRIRPLALGYIRVSTVDQAVHGVSLDAQRATLQAEADRQGWDLEIYTDEGLSAKTMKRPALQDALARLDAGDADVLLAVRIDRVSRSVGDFARLVNRAERKNWQLVLTEISLDTSTPTGRFVANVLAAAAQFESDMTSQRTRESMQYRISEGARMGRGSGLPTSVVERILADREAGLSYATIADDLNRAGIPASRGGVWYPASVRGVERSLNAQDLREAN